MPVKSEGERKRGMRAGNAMRGRTIGEAAIGDTPIFISTPHWAPIFQFGFTFPYDRNARTFSGALQQRTPEIVVQKQVNSKKH